jgi:signal transduction histidine kinase
VVRQLGLEFASVNQEWYDDSNCIVVIVESEDRSTVYGGARLVKYELGKNLPIISAISEYEPKILDFLEEHEKFGIAELCGLWNSAEVYGMGVGSVHSIRAAIAASFNVGFNQIIALCSAYTSKMSFSYGLKRIEELGNKGSIYYQSAQQDAYIMYLSDTNSMLEASEKERNIIHSLRVNGHSKLFDSVHDHNFDVSYNIQLNLPIVSESQSIVVLDDSLLSIEFGSYDIYTSTVDSPKKIDELEWKSTLTQAPCIGLSTKNEYLVFTITNNSEFDDWMLYIDNSAIDKLDLYEIVNGDIKLIDTGGELISFNKKNDKKIGYSFKIDIAKAASKKYVLHFDSFEQTMVPVLLAKNDHLIEFSYKREIALSFYFGIMVFIFLYSLFLFVSTRDREYSTYLIYIFTVGLTQLVMYGFANKYFWPNSGEMATIASVVIPALSGIGTILFASTFLKVRHYSPFIYKLLNVFLILYLIASVLPFFGIGKLAFLIVNFNGSCAIILVIAAIRGIKGGLRQAKFFLVAWSIFVLGVTIFAMRNFGIVPNNIFTTYFLPFGSVLEFILLSFAFADKINTLKKEKEQAQQRELEALKENEQKLEQKVIQRTSELEMAKNEVQRNYDHLRITQRQLVEAEKLSGLGQMTAGIAHELNNPINFVSSNIAPLNRDVDEVIKFMNEFEKLPEHTTQEQLDDLKAKYKGADMPYVKQEIDQLMKGISEGARRTAEIVKGLRIFARADRDTLVKANVNECMDATLVVMKSTYKDEITLVKELDPTLPELDCFPGKLNQVFANIISNAVHATRAMGRPKGEQKIWIKTWADDDNLYVSIKDNGKGMTEDVKERIFEPFYTTKGVGEGTGLGLSISLGIIEEHKGDLVVNTQQNKGTEFLIAIPRNLSQIRNLAA